MNVQMVGEASDERVAASKAHLSELKSGKFSQEQLLAWVNSAEFVGLQAEAWEIGLGQEYADFQRAVQMNSLGMPATVEEVNIANAAQKPKIPYGLIAAGAAAYFFLR